MEKLDSDFRKPVDDGTPKGPGTGGLNAPSREGRGAGTGGLRKASREGRGEGTGGLNAPIREGRGEGTGGLSAPIVDAQARGAGTGGVGQALAAAFAPPPAPPALLRSLVVARGSKAPLRAKLECALLGLVGVALDVFDAILEESPERPAADGPPPTARQIPETRSGAPWEAAGFTVDFQSDGSAIVSSVIGDSPAGRARLEPLDVIAAIEDNGKPLGAADLVRGWNKGLKFTDHSLVVEKPSGARALLSIPKR